MRKYTVEFIGTFFLVFVIGMSVRGSAGQFAPIAIGGILMVMIFAGGHISGGHFNPAVSLAALIRGALPKADFLPYVIAQVVGALAAGGLVVALLGKPVFTGSPELVPSLVVEFLATFALAWTVLNVATAKANANNSFYGLAIGSTVMVMAYAVGGISGGAFNPAVGFALPLMGLVNPGQSLVYLVANLLGGAVAGLAFNALARTTPTSTPSVRKA